MPGGLVGQGAEFSRSSCVLVELTVRQLKRVSISPLSLFLSLSRSLQNLSRPSLPPPSACLAQCPDLLKLTLNQKYPLSLPLPSLPPSPEHIPLAQQRSFHHSGWHWIISLPPAHSSQRGGQGRGVAADSALCDYIITEQQSCIQYIKRNLSLAYFIWWWLNTSVLLLDPTNWIDLRASAAESDLGMLFTERSKFEINLEL